MPSGHSSRSEMEIELSKLSSPRIFLVRMLVFLVLCALVAVVLYKQIWVAFLEQGEYQTLHASIRQSELDQETRQMLDQLNER